MTRKLLMTAALSLGLGTAVAMAQNDMLQPDSGAAPGTGTEAGLPMDWQGPIGDAFFADTVTGTLRTEEEVRANWQGLTDEQQAAVRSHCATVDTAAAEQPDDEMTTGSVTAGDVTASIERVCDWVDTM